jgi:predicted porin
VAPYNALEYFRLYPGVDAMATNGLRYGGMTEIRENWSAQSYNSAAPAAASAYNSNGNPSSGFTCTQTLYVRRAFVYFASDKVGIVRLGQGDDVTGSFDNGVTTFQNFDTGNWNGDAPTPIPGNLEMSFPFLSQQGADYGSNKVVYFSPQFAGFDFGLSWAPNNVNGEAPCGNAGSACTSLSSSSTLADGARWMDHFEVGARYQGTLGPVAIYAMAAYVGSGHVDYTGAPPAETSGSTWNGKYNSISAGDVGVAVTIAGFTVGGHYLGGTINNVNSTNPNGAPQSQAWMLGVQYATGPFVVGTSYYNYQEQGAPQLTGVTQRYTDAFDLGGTWNAAPGLYFYAQYMWGQQHQGQYNFIQGAAGSSLGNTTQAQVLVVGTKVRW